MKEKYLSTTFILAVIITLVLSISCGILLYRVRAKTHKDLFEYLELFYDIYIDISDYYIEELRQEILEEGAIRGLLMGANPYNDFIVAGGSSDLFVSYKDKAHAGILIGFGKDKVWTVMNMIPGSAAHKTGLKIGDKLMQINDQLLYKMYLSEIYDLLSGSVGEKVSITVLRGSPLKQVNLEIKLEPFQPFENITTGILSGNIGYLRIASFEINKFEKKILSVLKNFRRKNIQGLIIDLRNNSMGDIQVGYRFSDFFLKDGNLMGYCKRKPGLAEKRFESSDSYNFSFSPLVILVDLSTVSAAEVVVGAFKDLKRGVIIGETTFGKSLKIENFEQDGALLRLATGYYFTPNGTRIYLNGIEPNIELKTEPYYFSGKDVESDPLVMKAKTLMTTRQLSSLQQAGS